MFIAFINIQWIIFMDYIIVYNYIYIIRSAIYVFSVKKGGGREFSFRFSVLPHHGLFCVFSDE